MNLDRKECQEMGTYMKNNLPPLSGPVGKTGLVWGTHPDRVEMGPGWLTPEEVVSGPVDASGEPERKPDPRVWEMMTEEEESIAAAAVPSPPAQESTMTTSTGVMLTVERYNDLLEGERGLWATLKAHGKLVAALMKIRDNAAADSVAIARDALSTDLREIDWSALDALKALPPS